MRWSQLSPHWFDLMVAVILITGLLRGRKRGMSEELLDVFQWLCIVVVSALFYEPFGRLLAEIGQVSLLLGFVVAYSTIAMSIKLIFSYVKRGVGEKLVGSDVFGVMEYYLGALAGLVRHACVLLVLLALLNARYTSEEELDRVAEMQRENFGSITFPTLGSLQKDVFYDSNVGRFIRRNLQEQLIRPTPSRRMGGDDMGWRRQRELDQLMRGRASNHRRPQVVSFRSP